MNAMIILRKDCHGRFTGTKPMQTYPKMNKPLRGKTEKESNGWRDRLNMFKPMNADATIIQAKIKPTANRNGPNTERRGPIVFTNAIATLIKSA